MAAYKAFSAPAVAAPSSAGGAPPANGGAELSAERLQEKQAIAKMEALQAWRALRVASGSTTPNPLAVVVTPSCTGTAGAHE